MRQQIKNSRRSKKLDEKRREIDSLKQRILFLEKKIKDFENK